MKPKLRQLFDTELEAVLAQLPAAIHEILEEVPLYVEDFPSLGLMKQLHIERRDELCGLYTGVALTERTSEDSGMLSDAVQIFREGIIAKTIDVAGEMNLEELRNQIRITILHELGHHHGLDEDDLHELGYG
ncbi:metallopeptidase family protein [Blastopirellula sp. JC732]|uniref:Metallopeptidase family protein n=1 Tax=Blastopirellula sediminis TaxID=2894196 RepID=A0A9X1MKU2_9BACT|nr:metallopeptidase family protein [Blastopirellula sediminis]MCC9607858.1 metallopeptidase family protein [Blastopirellula sediminis]MCC9627349.1 metallopeptidase family protein [Blastopirellula sediminis]